MPKIRRRTRAVSAFPDGHSALMPCAARLPAAVVCQFGIK